MSYILESLKKSEQKRREGNLPGLQSEPLGPITPVRRRRPWLVGLLLVLLVGNLTLAVWLLLRPEASVESPKSAGTERENTALPTPLAVVPEPQIPTEPPAASRQARFVAPPAEQTPSAERLPVEPPADGRPREVAGDPPVILEGQAAPILYRQANMPRDLRDRLPEFELSMHYFAGEGRGGMVRLNGRMLRPGDAFDAELTVAEIVPDGVVLAGRDFRLLVERP